MRLNDERKKSKLYLCCYLLEFKIIIFRKQFYFCKGCSCYLNRCTTSPTYILYQLNEKKKIFFDLKYSIFKKVACQQLHPLHKPLCVYEIHNRKIKASQHSNYVAYWNAQMNPASKIKTIRLTVSFMLNTKIKKTDYKCMISLFFYHCP